MSCLGRFYVLGPPVQSAHAVEDVVSYVMRQTPDMETATFVLHDTEGPVRYDSTWVLGGRLQEIRHGPGVAELWTGLVLWSDARSAKSFSVIVMDEKYLQTCIGHRYILPKFETFVIGGLRVDHPGVSCVYELHSRAVGDTWRHRGSWLTQLIEGSDDSNRLRCEAVEALRTASWHSLYDLEALFAVHGTARASRRERRGTSEPFYGCCPAERPPRLDVILPYGLDKFLASVSQRPRCFEELCRVLWDKEESGHQFASMPPWFRDTCASLHVTSSEHLQQWWWAGIMGAAANAVQQLRACVPRHQPVAAEAVKGLSHRHYRTLDRNPLDSVDHTILIEECIPY